MATRARTGGAPRLFPDAGAVIALTRGDWTVRARLREAVKDEAGVVVPPIVVTETIRGGPADAPINQLFKTVRVPVVDLPLAREAGRLLGIAKMADATDAQIMAEALRGVPSVVLTSDPEDMTQLCAGRPGVRIVAV